HWAWHSAPIPAGLDPKQFRYQMFDTYGRDVPYATSNKDQKPLFDWLRENPHRLHLGRIGLLLKRADGSPATPDDLTSIEQTLDLWTGTLTSRFSIAGAPVLVRTCCHPLRDLLAVEIASELIDTGRLSVLVAIPYGSSNVN